MPADPHLNLPKRDVPALVEALRIRALALTGAEWERNATAAMMNEAADMLERAEPVAVPSSAPTPQDVYESVREAVREDFAAMKAALETAATENAQLREGPAHEYYRDLIHRLAREIATLNDELETMRASAPVAVPAPPLMEGDTANVIGRAADLIRDLRTVAAEPIREETLVQGVIQRHLTSAVAKGVAIASLALQKSVEGAVPAARDFGGHLEACWWNDIKKRYECAEGCEIARINIGKQLIDHLAAAPSAAAQTPTK